MVEAALPTVSVVVPCRNEGRHIEACLRSILRCDYPAGLLQVVVVDGMSDDGTRDRILEIASREPRVRMLDNPSKVTPAALNTGIAETRGEIVIRMDAHGQYPSDYIRRLVDTLRDRLILPVLTDQDQIRGFIGRDTLSSPGFCGD